MQLASHHSLGSGNGKEPTIRVLVIDDSALARRVISRVLMSRGGIEIIGSAASPADARRLLTGCDVVTLDAHMEPVDGISFLREYMRTNPVPTVLVSAYGQPGSGTRVEALCAGASSVIAKPEGWGDKELESFSAELHAAVREAVEHGTGLEACRETTEFEAPDFDALYANLKTAEPEPVTKEDYGLAWTPEVIGLGVSTGGANALRRILPMFPSDGPPILIVDHMPPGYTADFAAQVSQVCAIEVVEASSGQRLQPGVAYIAPGGDRHLEIERRAGALYAMLVDGPPDGGHRPSVNRLLRSLSRTCGANASAAVLTGMGRDGANGLLDLRRAGGFTVAQDEVTSIVYGMPKVAAEVGGARAVLPLDNIPERLLRGK